MTITDFKRIENLFTMFRNVNDLTAERVSKSIDQENNPLIKKFLSDFLDMGGGGVKNTVTLLRIINDFVTPTASQTQNQQIFNTLFDFYSNTQGGVLTFSSSSYKCPGGDLKTPELINSKLYFVADRTTPEPIKKTITTVLSHSPYLSLCNRDVNAVEAFLNFLPTTVISRCVPYCDIEFVFDRPADESGDDKSLAGPTLLRFLNDDKKRGQLSPVDRAMVNAREVSFAATAQYDVNTAGVPNNRVQTSTGMEMFLSPQTLVNMDPRANDGRYFPVLDRTRPLLSLESVTINCVATTGLLSHKTATMALKLHDKSRLSEVAELLEPYGTNRVSLWLTYGWRHPDEGPQTNIAQTYGQFINEKMILKECYGLKNATYSFDATGQCTITCELYTKSVDELLGITLAEESGFDALRKKKRELTTKINTLMKKLNLHSLKLDSKEIRPFQILSAAAGGRQPTIEAKEIGPLINKLIGFLREKTVKKGDSKPSQNFNEKDVDELDGALKEYYDESTGKKGTTDPGSLAAVTEKFISEKFEALSDGFDPFIQFESKFTAKSTETGQSQTQKPEYWDELKTYFEPSGALKKGSVCSFGKLFLTFMAPALNVADSIDESQIFFYTINEYAGLARGMNIAHFPVEIEVFKSKFKEYITRKASAALTAHEIITLAVDSQFKNLSAIPYGFKSMSKTLFEGEGADTKIKEPEKFELRSLALNKDRGAFKIPKISLYIETLNAGTEALSSWDKLSLYEAAASFKNSAPKNKIVRFHILDEVSNPNAPVLTAVREAVKNYDPSSSSADVYVNQEGVIANIESEITRERGGKDNPAGTRKYEFRTSTIYKEVTDTYSAEIRDRESLRRALARYIPTLIPGMNASGIIEVSLASKADPLVKTALMTGFKSGRELQGGPRGSDAVGDIPVRIIPSEMTIRTIGCPLVAYGQKFFVDMNTGTTIDNIYGVTNMTHSFSPGKYETSMKLTAWDSYAQIETADSVFQEIKNALEVFKKKNNT